MGGYCICHTLIAVIYTIVNVSAGNTIYSTEGENKVLQWNITPPPGNNLVYVKSPRHETLFTKYGTPALLVSGRVSDVENTSPITGHIEFTLHNVTVEDAGIYTTMFRRAIIWVYPAGVTLVVYMKPSKPILTVVVKPLVGQNMTLQCSASSNSAPHDHELTMVYKWYMNDANLPADSRYNATDHQLHVDNVQVSDSNSTFTCIGYEIPSILSDVSDRYTPNVKYGPGEVSLSPDTIQYVKGKDDEVGPITCRADCNPSCTCQWKFNGSNIAGVSNRLTINNITNRNVGSYWCSASNEYGSHNSETVSIILQLKPINTTINLLKDYKEGESVSIYCSTKSFPRSSITIYSSSQTVLYSRQNVLSVTYYIPHVMCVDSGVIRCVAENSIGKSEVNTTLNVLCFPRPDHKRISDTQQRIATGGDMDISGTFISNPMPKIAWTFRRGRSSYSADLLNNTDSVQVFNKHSGTRATSRAVIRNFAKTDFGEYILTAKNKYGESRIVFHAMMNDPSEDTDHSPQKSQTDHSRQNSQTKDSSMFKAGITMLVIGVVCLAVFLTLIVIKYRRKHNKGMKNIDIAME